MSDDEHKHDEALAEPDFIWGAEEIGEFLGLTQRQVYYLADTGHAGDAIFRIGDRLVARRSRLLKLGGGGPA
jgi:hypothetical protein